jgi:hypothetical protein
VVVVVDELDGGPVVVDEDEGTAVVVGDDEDGGTAVVAVGDVVGAAVPVVVVVCAPAGDTTSQKAKNVTIAALRTSARRIRRTEELDEGMMSSVICAASSAIPSRASTCLAMPPGSARRSRRRCSVPTWFVVHILLSDPLRRRLRGVLRPPCLGGHTASG